MYKLSSAMSVHPIFSAGKELDAAKKAMLKVSKKHKQCLEDKAKLDKEERVSNCNSVISTNAVYKFRLKYMGSVSSISRTTLSSLNFLTPLSAFFPAPTSQCGHSLKRRLPTNLPEQTETQG